MERRCTGIYGLGSKSLHVVMSIFAPNFSFTLINIGVNFRGIFGQTTVASLLLLPMPRPITRYAFNIFVLK
jgi:hypothetical protein